LGTINFVREKEVVIFILHILIIRLKHTLALMIFQIEPKFINTKR
jgi:hypothetical protein